MPKLISVPSWLVVPTLFSSMERMGTGLSSMVPWRRAGSSWVVAVSCTSFALHLHLLSLRTKSSSSLSLLAPSGNPESASPYITIRHSMLTSNSHPNGLARLTHFVFSIGITLDDLQSILIESVLLRIARMRQTSLTLGPVSLCILSSDSLVSPFTVDIVSLCSVFAFPRLAPYNHLSTRALILPRVSSYRELLILFHFGYHSCRSGSSLLQISHSHSRAHPQCCVLLMDRVLRVWIPRLGLSPLSLCLIISDFTFSWGYRKHFGRISAHLASYTLLSRVYLGCW